MPGILPTFFRMQKSIENGHNIFLIDDEWSRSSNMFNSIVIYFNHEFDRAS